jgi:hypothetical protein
LRKLPKECGPIHLFVKIHTPLFPLKKLAPKFGKVLYFKIKSKEKNRPIGENSHKLVPLGCGKVNEARIFRTLAPSHQSF